MSRISIAVACSALLASAALGQSERKTLQGSDVAVWNLVGKLKAVAGTGSAVEVEITRVGPDASKLRVETGRIGNRETLRIVYPSDRIVYPDWRRGGRTELQVREDGTFNEGDWRNFSSRDRVIIRGSGDGMEASADLTVSVPKGQRIALYLGVGRVEVTNVDGNVLIDVAAAEVEVGGTKGILSLDTGSGRVNVHDVTGDVTVDAGSGGMRIDRVKGTTLNIDSGSGGIDATDVDVKDFKADVGSGGFSLRGLKAATVHVETGSGGAEIELASDVERMSVETGSGGVTIRAPANFSAEIECETGSGGFQTDFDVVTRRLSRNHVAGRIGDGKGRVHLEAGSGRVRLLKS